MNNTLGSSILHFSRHCSRQRKCRDQEVQHRIPIFPQLLHEKGVVQWAFHRWILPLQRRSRASSHQYPARWRPTVLRPPLLLLKFHPFISYGFATHMSVCDVITRKQVHSLTHKNRALIRRWLLPSPKKLRLKRRIRISRELTRPVRVNQFETLSQFQRLFLRHLGSFQLAVNSQPRLRSPPCEHNLRKAHKTINLYFTASFATSRDNSTQPATRALKASTLHIYT